MKDMKFVCLCEDVTEEDIIKAIKEGFDDIFSLRMFTGAGTGSCQGKFCAINLVKILAKLTNRSIDEIGLPSFRTPLKPISVDKVVGEEE
ncbi:MAG: (2Fe-2S)-binding protein [Candidatus Njordarchaeia archaeon]